MKLNDIARKLEGVVAITATPFTPDNTLDEDSLSRIVENIYDAGIEVLTVNGNTGEYYSLSDEERASCLAVVRQAAPEAVVIAGIDGPVSEAISSAKVAQAQGADAVMIHHPNNPHITQEGWVNYHADIAVAIPDMGVIPYLKSPLIGADEINMLKVRAENFIAVKYALPDPVQFAEIKTRSQHSDIVWIAGLAESYAISQFAAGATGFTSGLVNVAPQLSLRFYQHLQRKDFPMAMKEWEHIRDFEALRARDSDSLNVSVVKEALFQQNKASRAVRPPITELTAQDQDFVARMMESFVPEPAKG